MSNTNTLFPLPFIQRPAWINDTFGFILSRQREGGFTGRSEKPDLYYTFFAILCLYLMSRLDALSAKTEAFIVSAKPKDIVHIYAKMASCVLLKIKPDQSEHHRMKNAAAEILTNMDEKTDLYSLFLSVFTLHLIKSSFETGLKSHLVQLIASKQRKDGGFTSDNSIQTSTTNQTSAAVGALQMLGSLESISEKNVLRFYESVISEQGGFCASPGINMPDLLSTCTSLTALSAFKNKIIFDTNRMQKFILQLKENNGGFKGVTFDTESDIEYTYYGLASLSIINSIK